MFLVAGLGNPGPRYAETRHNIGFRVVEAVSGNAAWRSRFQAEVCQLELQSSKLLLLKPQTYMNLSGISVRQAMDYFRVPQQQLLVVHDELDLPFGQLKLKRGGGEAGHNGLRSISQHLGTKDYFRLRLGIGKPAGEFATKGKDFVLDAFAPHEQEALQAFVAQGVDAVERFVRDGPDTAMNEVNRKR